METGIIWILVDMGCSMEELKDWIRIGTIENVHILRCTIENVHILLDKVKAIPGWCVACRDAVPGF